MNKIKEGIEVLIPVKLGDRDASNLVACLMSLYGKKLNEVNAVTILDSSSYPALPVMYHRIVSDISSMFRADGIDFTIINKDTRGIGHARRLLMEQAKHEYSMFLDSDISINTMLINLRDLEEYSFIAPYVLNTTGPVYQQQSGESLWLKQFNPDRPIKSFLTTMAGCFALLFKTRVTGFLEEHYKEFLSILDTLGPCEDMAITKYISMQMPGCLHSGYTAYHMGTTGHHSWVAKAQRAREFDFESETTIDGILKLSRQVGRHLS